MDQSGRAHAWAGQGPCSSTACACPLLPIIILFRFCPPHQEMQLNQKHQAEFGERQVQHAAAQEQLRKEYEARWGLQGWVDAWAMC